MFASARWAMCLALFPPLPGKAAPVAAVSSPDGLVEFRLLQGGERLEFAVTFRGQAVLDPSQLGILLDGVDLTQGAEIGEGRRYVVDESYPWRGAHAKARNHCLGAAFPVKHVKSGMDYTFEVRAFGDGVAFRHVFTGEDKPRIPDESTVFRVPDNSMVWYHDLAGHYEGSYQRRFVSEATGGQWIALPMTYKLPGGAGYASITEAALARYSGMALQSDGQRGFQIALGHRHPPSYPFRLRYSNDVERLSRPASISGTVTSPWRVVLVGADLNALVNSDVVHNLCPPPDPKLFPDGMNTDWVKPGRAVWKYLDGGANTFEEMRNFSKWAGELGFEYHVIEGFWTGWSEAQLRELVEESRERGVGVWLWRHSRELRTPEAREEFFSRLERLGVVGAKVDFFDHEHREVVDLYSDLLESAARHRILVNFHGANKPTGEARTWPNEIIREAVRGMESSRLKDRAGHNTTLPFTRFLAGPGDYTPVHFGLRRGDTTWIHQVATAAVFNEPLLTYAAHPTNLLASPTLEMIKSIPPVWDETLVLPESEIGALAALARRTGDTWFLAVVNGPGTRKLQTPLAFLGPGEYRARLFRDQPDAPSGVNVEERTVRRGDSLSLDLPAGWGFIGRFERL